MHVLADELLPAEHIQNKYGVEENKKRQLSYRLQQLKDSLESGPVELPTFRELLKQELQQNEKARKEALHALIEMWKLSLELGRRLKEPMGDWIRTPTSQHTPYRVLPR